MSLLIGLIKKTEQSIARQCIGGNSGERKEEQEKLGTQESPGEIEKKREMQNGKKRKHQMIKCRLI